MLGTCAKRPFYLSQLQSYIYGRDVGRIVQVMRRGPAIGAKRRRPTQHKLRLEGTKLSDWVNGGWGVLDTFEGSLEDIDFCIDIYPV